MNFLDPFKNKNTKVQAMFSFCGEANNVEIADDMFIKK